MRRRNDSSAASACWVYELFAISHSYEICTTPPLFQRRPATPGLLVGSAVKLTLPPTVKSVPMKAFFATPKPPAVRSDPVTEEDASVVVLITRSPVELNRAAYKRYANVVAGVPLVAWTKKPIPPKYEAFGFSRIPRMPERSR